MGYSLRNYFFGETQEEELALVYSAVDLTAVPSLQENLPYVVLESMACGIPVIAFNIGGIPDMIVHEKMVIWLTPYEAKEFAKGIGWILENEERHRRLGVEARRKVEEGF